MVSELDRTSLLRYENVSISFGAGRREKFALRDFSLTVGVGERVALVGESGSGKTLSALAPLQLEPEGAKVSGKIWWHGNAGLNTQASREVDLLSLPLEQIRSVRGREIAMIFQEPMTALNPLYTIGNQLVEAVLIHEPLLS